MKTKQDIFPLYVGKCKYKHNYRVKNLKDSDIFDFDTYTLYQLCTGNARYDDCQLILKRIGDMSEEDATTLYDELGWQGGYTGEKLLNQFRQMFEYFTGWQNMNAELMFTFKESVIVNNFLIRKGYALDDEWFTNGIAVEVGK